MPFIPEPWLRGPKPPEPPKRPPADNPLIEVEFVMNSPDPWAGMLLEAQEALLDILEVRFGPVPNRIQQRVRRLTDLAVLRQLRRRALTVPSLKEFERELPS